MDIKVGRNAIKEASEKLSNWGRWGKDDQIGTLNHIRPEDVVRAAGLIRRGKVFALGIPLDRNGPQTGLFGGRFNPIHQMLATGTDAIAGRWMRGIATEAGKAWVDYGFAQLGLTRIEAGVNADNVASLRVVEKLGFQWIRSGGTDGVRWHDLELRKPATRHCGCGSMDRSPMPGTPSMRCERSCRSMRRAKSPRRAPHSIPHEMAFRPERPICFLYLKRSAGCEPFRSIC